MGNAYANRGPSYHYEKDTQKIYLGNHHLMDTTAVAFAKALKNQTALVSLDLTRNLITHVGLETISNALPHLPLLKRVEFDHNPKLTDMATESFAHFLSSPKISSFKASNCGLNNIAPLAPLFAPLKILSLSSNMIGDTGFHDLAESASHYTRLYSLQLEDVGLTHVGCKHVAKILQSCTNLVEIHLSHNQKIGGDGAVVIMEAVSNCMLLMRVELEDCGIDWTQEQLVQVVEYLKSGSNQLLSKLALKNNPFQPLDWTPLDDLRTAKPNVRVYLEDDPFGRSNIGGEAGKKTDDDTTMPRRNSLVLAKKHRS